MLNAGASKMGSKVLSQEEDRSGRMMDISNAISKRGGVGQNGSYLVSDRMGSHSAADINS